MRTIHLIAIFSCFYLASASVWAVKIYECEDELGNRTFQKQCSPGSTPVKQKNYSIGAGGDSDENELGPLVLYRIPDCLVCDQVKEYVAEKNLTLTEKNVADDYDLQQELKNRNGGVLRVPVLLIGDKTIPGYDPESISSALVDAGYIQAETQK